jgi:bifunctional enzyme CysN/CysC
MLRVLTCGSVDDGKSTLVGRLLVEAQRLPDDQRAALERDSRKWGTQGDAVDLSLLADGLQAEREQRITIDVAYRYLDTARRKIVLVDAPGHEQYTRNMVTGASNADLAVLLVDASRGPTVQTRRHAAIARLLNLRHLVLAVTKMDLVDGDEARFRSIASEFAAFAAELGLPEAVAIPLSALTGANVVVPSPAMPWYRGPTLLAHLESVELDDDRASEPLRLPVQWVNRPDAAFRGYCGQLAGGTLRPGDAVRIQPGGQRSRVARIVAPGGDRTEAVAGESVTVTLADAVDVGRGDLLTHVDAEAEEADRFECTIVWMHEAPLYPGRSYLLKAGTRVLGATVLSIRHRLDIASLKTLAATTLQLNDIGVCHLAVDHPIPFDPFEANPVTGGFVLIDRQSAETIGAGMIRFALRRSHNVAWQPLTVDKASRALLKGQRPAVLWLTGLSGAGKSTIANLVEARLFALGRHTTLLDGDNIRHGLSKDLGFTDADRIENIRRIAEVARLMVDAGLIVVAAFISPFRAEREMARALFAEGEFFEVHVDVPLEVAERRDPKGLYRKARRGELPRFTGIDSPYEAPVRPELRIDTSTTSAEAAADAIVHHLIAAGVFAGPLAP